MAIRLQGGFTSRKNDAVYVINIYDSSYSSTVIPFDLARDGLTEEYNHDDKGRNHTILTSSMKMQMLIKNDDLRTFITDVVNSAEGRFLLEVLKNGNKYWYGYVLPDLFTLQDIPDGINPVLTLKATDGIGRLQEIDYNDAGTTYTGNVAFIDHLFNILGKIGFDSFYGATEDYLETYVDWWDQNIVYDTSISPYKYSRVDHRAFIRVDTAGEVIYNSAYDILEQIVKAWNCRFLFSEGTYKLIQINAYETDGSTKVTKVYDKNKGETTTSTTDFSTWNKTTGLLSDYQSGVRDCYHNEGNFKYYPALREVEVQYEHFTTDNLIPGYVWTQDAFPIALYSDLDYNGGAARLTFTSTLETRSNFAVSTDFQVLRYRLRLQIKVGTYYLKRGYSIAQGSVKEQAPEWTTAISFVDVFSRYMISNNQPVVTTVSFETPPLEESGDLDVRVLFGDAINNQGQVVSTGFNYYYSLTNTNLQILVNGNVEEQTNIAVYTATNDDGSTNSKTEKIPVLIGDGPSSNTFGGIEVFNTGSSAWVDSSGWRKGNSGTYVDFGQLLANEIMAGQQLAIERYLGTVTGDFVAHGRLRRYAGVTITNYIFIGGRHNLHKDTWEGEWFQIDVDRIGISEAPVTNYFDPIRPPKDNGFPTLDIGNIPIIPGGTGTVDDVVTYDPDDAGPTQIQIDGVIQAGSEITTIPVDGIKSDDFLQDGDVVVIVTPTGEEIPVIVSGDVSAGDTTVDIIPVTPGIDIPEGSVIKVPEVDLYAYVQRSRKKTLNFFSDIRVTDAIVDGNPLFFFRVDESSQMYLNRATNVEIQVYTPGAAAGQYDFVLKHEGGNILSSTVSETTELSRAALDYDLTVGLYSFHVSNITGTVPVGVNFLLEYIEPLQKLTFIPTDSTINGEYAGDLEAFAGGVKAGALYQMSVDNYHGLPRGLVIQNYSAFGFSSDSTFTGATDEWFACSNANIYGIKKGAIKAKDYSGTAYADDSTAASGGIVLENTYTLSATNIYGLPAGLIKVRKV